MESDVGSRIRDARIARGLTQEQLVELAGISPSHISAIERDKYTLRLNTFLDICIALNMSADELLGDIIPASMKQRQISEIDALLSKISPDARARILRIVKAAID